MIPIIHDALLRSKEYKDLREALAEPGAAVLATGCVSSQKLHLIGAAEDIRCRLILTHSDLRVKEIAEEYVFYDRNVCRFPAKDLIFYQADLRGREIQTERLKCLRRIMEGHPVTVVTTFSALMTPQIPLRQLKSCVLEIRTGKELDLPQLTDRLITMGYEKNYQVERPGQFSVRGDILDIFDLTEENPCRIELWGDEVESIRSFDVLSQRSIETLSLVRIYPATELILTRPRLNDGLAYMKKETERAAAALKKQGNGEAARRLAMTVDQIMDRAAAFRDYSPLEGYLHYFYPAAETFLDHLPPEETLVFLDEPVRLAEHARAIEMEFRDSMASRAEKGYVLPGQMNLLTPADRVLSKLAAYRRLGLCEMLTDDSFFKPDRDVDMHAREAASFNRDFAGLVKALGQYRSRGARTVILTPSRTRARRLAQDLTDQGAIAFYTDNPARVLKKGEVAVCYGQVRRGFEYPGIGFALITETDIFGNRTGTVRKKRKKTGGDVIRDFKDLKVGDYVVHERHGIGIYRGMEKIEIEHIAKDYIKIEYAGGGVLYILPTELDCLQKYASADAKAPKVNKLGGQEWTRTRSRVKKAVEEVAEDLVALYARRLEVRGHAFEKDTVWQREFEETFPFDETEDQLQAIEDTKRDMESDRVMDRLICGDVGFGKTEIAIRAAFKAVQDGMQTAVLVPTTILAQQHFNTFTERMHSYPVRIGLLSRFRTSAEIKATLKELEAGTCDIVIGTHRLLSKDVKFKNLGLLVVDEEQRFGVTHKEKIKKMREDVDVLTLSATPIPRTLHMSLTGIRDMSVLEQPPQGRVPIQTYVMAYNPEMVREAIVRELSRQGQIYYVFNRIEGIETAAAQIAAMVPEARVSFAHGRMTESQLEKIMMDFVAGRIDVLVSTTIIETGLDISNVNTIIIHDSDRMGLSQLYQLRGRVGRSGRTAYAFLMYQPGKVLKEVAEKRLSAIREFTEMGSGFRIAMRDLEIRGAGSILGRSQHGHMSAVGYDLYCKMLGEAVRQAKGEPVTEERNVTVHLEVSAYIPETYILNEDQKLDIYRRIAAIRGTEDLAAMEDELRDRFGEIPPPAGNLLRIALIRSVAALLDINDITGKAGRIVFTFDPAARVRADKIPQLLRAFKGGLKFSAAAEPAFIYTYDPVGVLLGDEELLLNRVQEMLVAFHKHLRA